MHRNITLTLDDDLIHKARVLAARRNRSISALLREELSRLVAEGHHVRVYTPYGDRWYGYFMRRLAERPANLTFFLRSLTSRR